VRARSRSRSRVAGGSSIPETASSDGSAALVPRRAVRSSASRCGVQRRSYRGRFLGRVVVAGSPWRDSGGKSSDSMQQISRLRTPRSRRIQTRRLIPLQEACSTREIVKKSGTALRAGALGGAARPKLWKEDVAAICAARCPAPPHDVQNGDCSGTDRGPVEGRKRDGLRCRFSCTNFLQSSSSEVFKTPIKRTTREHSVFLVRLRS